MPWEQGVDIELVAQWRGRTRDKPVFRFSHAELRTGSPPRSGISLLSAAGCAGRANQWPNGYHVSPLMTHAQKPKSE